MIFFFLYHFYFISLLQKSNFIPMTEKDSSKDIKLLQPNNVTFG